MRMAAIEFFLRPCMAYLGKRHVYDAPKTACFLSKTKEQHLSRAATPNCALQTCRYIPVP